MKSLLVLFLIRLIYRAMVLVQLLLTAYQANNICIASCVWQPKINYYSDFGM